MTTYELVSILDSEIRSKLSEKLKCEDKQAVIIIFTVRRQKAYML